MRRLHSGWTLAFLAGLLAVSIWIAVHIGPVEATPEILRHLRVPRVLLGVVVGMALASAGAVFQGLLRNPLADPFLLGTSSGASVGVMAAGVLGWHHPAALYGLALSFAFGAVLAVNRLAQTDGRTPVQTLILAGVLVSTLLNALVLLGLSLFYRQTFSTIFFMMGSLTESNPVLLKTSSILVSVALCAVWYLSRDLNVLAQGEESAHHLGLDPEPTKRVLFLLGSVLVAAAVAVSGMIGFVGLVVPHIVRALVGPDHRVLLPGSALFGALLLVSMDAAARTLAAPTEIPVGVVAALGGTPFFLYLLRAKRGETF
jgi:iron complex transport system permease protein